MQRKYRCKKDIGSNRPLPRRGRALFLDRMGRLSWAISNMSLLLDNPTNILPRP